MLHVCLPHKHGSCAHRTNTKFDTLHTFRQTGPLRRVNALARCGNIGSDGIQGVRTGSCKPVLGMSGNQRTRSCFLL